jgi:hypothetical protein
MFRLLRSHFQAIHELCSPSMSSTYETLAHYWIPYGFALVVEIKYCLKLIDKSRNMAKKCREAEKYNHPLDAHTNTTERCSYTNTKQDPITVNWKHKKIPYYDLQV